MMPKSIPTSLQLVQRSLNRASYVCRFEKNVGLNRIQVLLYHLGHQIHLDRLIKTDEYILPVVSPGLFDLYHDD